MPIDQLAPRILALPADIRAALAGVGGPGWMIRQRDGEILPMGRVSLAHLSAGWDFWPANPAASVAAVLDTTIWHAHMLIGEYWPACVNDHAAALSIIEAHVANRSSNG